MYSIKRRVAALINFFLSPHVRRLFGVDHYSIKKGNIVLCCLFIRIAASDTGFLCLFYDSFLAQHDIHMRQLYLF